MVAIRKQLKNLLLDSHIPFAIKPLSGPMRHLAYLAEFSRWRSDQRGDFYRDPCAGAYDHSKRYSLYQHVLDVARLDGRIDYLEFGVAGGASLRWWLRHNRHPMSRFVGFDTFTGLPEDWGVYKQGTFSMAGRPPDVGDERCSFQIGLFQDTLGPFLQRWTWGERKVIHLDADLYSSTLYVLVTLAGALRPGDVLVFDEFGSVLHEYRALEDFLASFRMDVRLLGEVNNFSQVAFVVEKPLLGAA